MVFTNLKTIFFDTADTLYTNEEMEAAYPKKLVEMIAVTRKISDGEAENLFLETAQKLKGTVKHVTKVRTMAELGFSRAQVHEAFCTVNPKDFLTTDEELSVMMALLARKYKLGIISNFKRSHVFEILAALGLSPEWFPLLVTEDIVKEIKPDHEPFLKAVELSGYTANECLYVGDSPTKDMQPAKEVGMVTILIGASVPDEQVSYIDATIPDVKKLATFLEAS
jgi:HAD superfamily hydrolase (TIGR01549 family)